MATARRYKGEYEPSELLCPRTLRWVPLDAVLRSALEVHDGTPCLEDVAARAHMNAALPSRGLAATGGASASADVRTTAEPCAGDGEAFAPCNGNGASARALQVRVQLRDVRMAAGDMLPLLRAAGQRQLMHIASDFADHLGERLAGALVLKLA
jgi:pyrimidine deaminase RibD-like protein